jgi:hypothetical protein
MVKQKIYDEDVINLNSMGISDRAASKVLHCSHSTFRFRRMKLGLPRNFNSLSSKHVPLSDYKDYIKRAHKNINKRVGKLRRKGNRLYASVKEYNEKPETRSRVSLLRKKAYPILKIKHNKRCIDCDKLISFKSEETKRCNHCRGEKTGIEYKKRIWKAIHDKEYIGTKEISRRAEVQWNTAFKYLSSLLVKGIVENKGRVEKLWRRKNTTLLN